MNMIGFLLFFFAPLPVLYAIARIRILRRRKRETTVEPLPKPFAPEPVLADGALLRRFSPVQRVYLRQQIPAVRVGCVVVIWFVFSALAPAVLPTSVSRFGLHGPQAQRAWYSFLLSTRLMPSFLTMIALFTAVFTVSGLAGAQRHTAFNRTRPLERRFIFWGRVLPALFSLVIGYITGALLAFGTMVAVYGPVWHNLDLFLQLSNVRPSDARQLIWFLLAPWKVFISIGIDMVFVFGIAMLFLLQPLQFKNAPKVLVSLWAGFCCFLVFSVTGVFGADKVMGLHNMLPVISRFGLFTDVSGVPPPMIMYLVPLALIAMMLWFAQLAAARKED